VVWEGRSQWVKATYLFSFYGKLKIQLPILGKPKLCAKDGKINVQRFHIPIDPWRFSKTQLGSPL
jgi:hypothetical protein